jgi:hypothetical protein
MGRLISSDIGTACGELVVLAPINDLPGCSGDNRVFSAGMPKSDGSTPGSSM